jgi:hypothetical protein
MLTKKSLVREVYFTMRFLAFIGYFLRRRYDATKIVAGFRDGALQVHLPKMAVAKSDLALPLKKCWRSYARCSLFQMIAPM